MDAFTVLDELAGGVVLTPDQMAQVRALNVRYYTAVFRLQQTGADGQGRGPGPETVVWSSGKTGLARADLDGALRADVRAVLTPAQWQRLHGD